MKKIGLVLVVLTLIAPLTIYTKIGLTNPVVQHQLELVFEGEWIISNYQERGNKTLKFDGEIVRISKENNIYYVEGSNDWFFTKTKKFRLEKESLLVGIWMPDFNDLKEIYSNVPSPSDSVLTNAIGKIVCKGTLTMLQNGHIVVKYDNFSINRNQANRFHSVTMYPDWYQFILTRKN